MNLDNFLQSKLDLQIPFWPFGIEPLVQIWPHTIKFHNPTDTNKHLSPFTLILNSNRSNFNIETNLVYDLPN